MVRGKALSTALLAAVAVLGLRTAFVGQPGSLARSGAEESHVALQAEKTKKKKMKLSLAEALDRQKEMEGAKVDKKGDAKLAPERTFWEGPPSSTELFAPFLGCFLVLGIIPFIAAANRQFRVKYKITDRRVSVISGLDGNDVTEFSFQEIYEMKYGLRWFGYCADMRINLRDGAKVELFGLLNFYDNYKFIMARCDKDARKRSDPVPSD